MRDDWKYVAMVIDRLLLYIFFGVTLGGTLGILLSAPNVFKYVDQQEIIDKLTNGGSDQEYASAATGTALPSDEAAELSRFL